jgi:ribonucleoside-diphosphate reductase alpha chain
MAAKHDTIADPIARDIWDMKYRLKQPGGTPLDQSIEDTWRRVATAVAEAEAPEARAKWAENFYRLLADYRFLPAGRILSGAGSGRSVTLFNCFVMGTLDDSMAGIFEGLKEAALTMQQGGGIGHDFSTLRPRGAPVKGVGADASGPLSFMDVWDGMCRTIMSAGSRRGAMMGTLACDHPDIEDFISAKRDPNRLRMFNLSVLVTDAFMDAVKADAPWPLVFAGTTYKTLRARDLWDQIMRSTYDYAEPGVIFIDRINRDNNLSYCETIHATNPCIIAESWIATTDGPRQVSELIGRAFTALVDGTPHASGEEGFFATGDKPVLRLRTREGYALTLTADHPVLMVKRRTRWSCETDWKSAGELLPGEEIVLNDHRAIEHWPGLGAEHEGYLIGLLIGDGTLKSDKAVLSAWPRAQAVNAPAIVDPMMTAALDAAMRLPHRADFKGWMEVKGRGEFRLASAGLRELALGLGMRPQHKTITSAIERASSEFCRGLLRGLFDTDGSVQGTQAKGVSVRLAQSDLACLESVQRILLRFGILATVYRNRGTAGASLLPDGHGGQRLYQTKAQHELALSGGSLLRFATRIGFSDISKQRRLETLIGQFKRRPNQAQFIATVESLEPAGTAPVFDVRIPGINRFDANGIMVHNCGEQPLPPYGACLLGSVNLARLIIDPFTDHARLDEAALAELVPLAVRFMDNVVDVSNYPLSSQAHEARAKRRLGLGVTGLADALAMTGLVYGSEEAAAAASRWMMMIDHAAYRASTALAREKGAFPLFDSARYLDGGHAQRLPAAIRDEVAQHGIRNALLTSIAPTGTISLFAGNVSSGIEPIFSISYERKVLMPDGSRRSEMVEDYAARHFRALHGADAPLPSSFVTAADLSPHQHLIMQAAVQRHVDSSISKTINCPPSLNFDDFKAVYAEAYDLGLKGCTTFRPNAVTGSVLSVTSAEPAFPMQPALPLEAPRDPVLHSEPGEVIYMKRPLERREVLPGFTYKLKWPESDHAIYITINDILQDGRRRPFEIFINSKNMEHYAWTVALTRMISAVFRRGGDVSFVVEELKAVFDPRGGQWMGGKYVPSLLAAIGGIIERHLIDTGFLKRDEESSAGSPALALVAGDRRSTAQCPRCGEAGLIFQEGCATCPNCGYSKCS